MLLDAGSTINYDLPYMQHRFAAVISWTTAIAHKYRLLCGRYIVFGIWQLKELTLITP